MALEEELQLDLSPALESIRGELTRAIEDIPANFRSLFDDQLQGVVSDFGAAAELAREEIDKVFATAIDVAPVDVPVNVDTSELDAVPAEIDAASSTIEAPVAVDDSELKDAAGQVQALDGETATVTVEADTSGLDQAQDQIDGLGSAARSSSVDMGQLSTSVGSVVSGVADLSRFGGGGGLLAGISAAAVGFAHAAIEADSATRSFEARVGDLADTLNRVDVAGINEDLSDFALRIGADDDQLRLALARFTQLGESSGRSRAEIGKLGQSLTAVSGYFSVLNPSLGTAEDIAQRLPQAFARGGRALTEYGITLTRTEVQQRALTDAHKTDIATLTQFDLAAAGLAITMENLGDKIAAGIDKGTESPAIKLRHLKTVFDETFEAAGAGLIDPLIASLEALTPPLASTALIVGKFASAFAEVLAPALEAITPALEAIAETAAAIPGPVLAASAAIVVLGRSLLIARAEAAGASGALSGLGTAAAAAGKSVTLVGVASAALGITLIKQGAAGKDASKDLLKLAGVANDELIPAFDKAVEKETGLFEKSGTVRKEQFAELARSSVATAERVRDGYAAAGRSVEDFDVILEKQRDTNKQAAADQKANADAVSDYADTTTEAADAVDVLNKAVQEQADAANNAASAFDAAVTSLSAYLGLAVDQGTQDLKFATTLDKLKEKQDEFTKSKGKTTAQYALETAAGRENIDGLIGIVEQQAKILANNIKADASPASIERATIKYNAQVDALRKVAAETGLTKTQFDGLLKSVGLLPDQVSAAISITGVDEAKEKADGFKSDIEKLPIEVRITTTLNESEIYQKISRTLAGMGPFSVPVNQLDFLNPDQLGLSLNAEGNVYDTVGVKAYAEGGVRDVERYANGEDHTAQIATSTRIFAEPETGGEAYIPLAPAKRDRSTAILGDVASRFGYELVPVGARRYADGAVVDTSAKQAWSDVGMIRVLERLVVAVDALPGKIPRGGDTFNVDATTEQQNTLREVAESIVANMRRR